MRYQISRGSRGILAGCLAAMLLWLGTSACAISGETTTQDVERSFEVGSGGTLNLSATRASVDVSSWGQDEVWVKAMLKAKGMSQSRAEDLFERYSIEFDQSGNDVAVTAQFDKPSFSFGDWGRFNVRFEVKVPEEYNLNVATSGGSIKAASIKGDSDLRTSGGSIKLGQMEGQVDARTSGGSISAEGIGGDAALRTSGGSISSGDVRGNLTAKTSGGSIRVAAVQGDVDAHTSGGSITITSASGAISAKTSGGSIKAVMTEPVTKSCTLKTSGGSIRLHLHPDSKVDIDAKTSGGRVTTDLPVTIRGKISKSKLEGQVNGGGHLITLRTSGGGIRIDGN